METGKGVSEKNGTENDLVLQISSSEDDEEILMKSPLNPSASSSFKPTKDQSFELTVQTNELSNSRPPKVPTEPVRRRPSIPSSTFAKQKSRLVQPPPPTDPKGPKAPEEKTQLKSSSNSPATMSPGSNKATAAAATSTTPTEAQRSVPITPKTPLISTPAGEEEDDEEVYKTANLKLSQEMGQNSKVRVTVWMEWTLFVFVVGVLIASLTVNWFDNRLIWGLDIWKWCVLVLVIFCGRLFTEWFINILVFLIERNFLLKKKVLYFVYGLKRSSQIFMWIGLILLTWALLFNRGVRRSRKTTRALNYITRGLASCLIAAAIWFVKNLLVKLLASSFQATRFFDRIQDSIFHQYVLRILSGPPVMEMGERVGRTPSTGQLSFKNLKSEKGNEKQDVIDVEKLKRMKQEKVSAWTMKGLVSVIRGTGLSTISSSLEDENEDEDEREEKDEEIHSEWEAKAAAYRIFQNVAKPRSKYIDEDDLLRFLKKEEVDLVLPMFEGAVETGKIKRKSLKNWLVKVYLERKALAHSLKDTKTAIEELNKLASVFVVVVIIIVWLVLMGLLTTQVLVFISSQILLIVFVFGNTAKTVFEAIIFVFVMHPFDVGDRCVVDGVQMIVEEMNILTTIFLRYDNEKIFYPNCVLATKPISNFFRSPEMSDGVEFSVDFSTSIETIAALKAKVKIYLESKPQYWRPGHSVVVKDIEDVNKMHIGLYVTHTINFQNYGDKSNRRSELVLELKRIFEELGIKYRLLPQQVQVSYAGSAPSTLPSPRQ